MLKGFDLENDLRVSRFQSDTSNFLQIFSEALSWFKVAEKCFKEEFYLKKSLK